MADNSSSLSLLTVLKPGGSSHIEAESKPAKTIDQMIALMSDRGLAITDETRLRQVLFDCNYYRLSGYFRPFQVNPAVGDNRYRPGTQDVDFLIPYTMDEELRNIILKGTAKVELTLRSRFAYLLASDGAYRNFCGALDWFSLSVGGVGVSRGGVEFVPVDAGPVCGRDAVVRFGRRCLFALPQGVGDE